MIYISDKKEIKSEVETALIRTCFLNLFSLDQIPQLRYSANAKYGMSFRCSPNINFRVVESFLNGNVCDSCVGNRQVANRKREIFPIPCLAIPYPLFAI